MCKCPQWYQTRTTLLLVYLLIYTSVFLSLAFDYLKKRFHFATMS